MCFCLISSPEIAPGQTASSQPLAHTPARPVYHPTQLEGDQRIIHALNRFTFGLRPGDVEAVRNLGLDHWFDRQLHPGTIDQTDLNARLAQYPAMQWSSEDLLYRLPSNAVIRQALDGKASVPERGALHAVYENQMYRVAEKRQEKQSKQQTSTDAASESSNPTPSTTATGAQGQQNDAAARLLDSLDNGMDKDEQAEGTTLKPAAAEPPQHAVHSAAFDAILALPPERRIARLAAMRPSEFDAFYKSLRGPERAALVTGMSPEMKEAVSALENPQRTVVEELFAQRLTRDIYSNTQLEEVMTDFWLNHFNVYLRKNEATPYYLVSYERDVIRPHVLGKFEDLLETTAHSPAMLLYLDNASSIGPNSRAAERARMAAERQPAKQRKAPQGLNENYARELMELHTLGVNGGYTQADVTQVARILTGWGVDRPQRGGGFRFEPNRHEPGSKKVLGKKFRENGEREGRDLLHLLATRPETAHFICRKLAIRFVSDDPPESLVESMARSFLSSGGDISAVLKTMYHSPEFWTTDVYRAKIKTPLEYVVSAARASNAEITNLRPLANALREMGMPLYGAVAPTGYKWDAADWVSTGALVNRMNFALSLSGNRLQGITTTWSSQPVQNESAGSRVSPVANPTPSDLPAEESRLESLLVAGQVSDTTRTAVMQQFAAQNGGPQNVAMSNDAHPRKAGNGPNAQEKQDQLLAGLLLGSPEFQRR
jgi:uncharacterized protein (DUF1800 family)